MSTSTVQIGERVVLEAPGGLPEVEYLLFDAGEIVLMASGPGTVHEVGYQTTAEDAAWRLKEAGASRDLALEAAAALQPSAALAFARGRSVRRVATFLGPTELFEGYEYDTEAQTYRGRWLDLAGIAREVHNPRLTYLLQALYWTSVLHEVSGVELVRLTTKGMMLGERPGKRSYRRTSLEGLADVPKTLRDLTTRIRDQPPSPCADGPTYEELLQMLRARASASSDVDAQDHIRGVEAALSIRERPLNGPLAAPALSAIELQLSEGRTAGVIERLDALEKAQGKSPAISYLRTRAAFLTGTPPPRIIAERAAAQAHAMPAFPELELLTAEAWNAAGEPKRAVAYTRDLLSNASVKGELKLRDSQRFEAPQPPPLADPSPPVTPRPPPPELPGEAAVVSALREPDPFPDTGVPAGDRATPAYRASQIPGGAPRRRTPPPSDRISTAPPPPLVPSNSPKEAGSARPRRMTPPMMSFAPEPPRSVRPGTRPGIAEDFGAPSLEVRQGASSPPRPQEGRRKISGTWAGPPPVPIPPAPPDEIEEPARPASVPPAERRSVPPPPAVPPRGRATPSHFGAISLSAPALRASPLPSNLAHTLPTSPPTPAAAPPTRRPSTIPLERPAPSSVPAPRITSRPAEPGRVANLTIQHLMRGASQPPFRSDSPEAHVHIPRAPQRPRIGREPETAVALSLPEGMTGVPGPPNSLPRSVLEARVQFTFLSRELGREYDEKLGLVLRADLTGIETMQRVLLERYANRTLTSVEAAADVRRHGAFLSEILARDFGAFWVDIGPSDVGYWAMVAPPETRVWPFGRILRLIAMQHNERDLVSYYLELKSRAASG